MSQGTMEETPHHRPSGKPAVAGIGTLAATVLLALATSLVARPALADSDDGESPDEIAARIGTEIEHGPVDAGRSVKMGRAFAVIPAPVDRVMTTITDYGHYDQFLPTFQESRVLSQRGNNAMVYLEALVARGTITLWAQMRLYERRPEGDTRIIEGRLVEGNMSTFVARFRVSPVDDGQQSLVEFHLLIDLDMPLPSSLLTTENVRNSRKALRALRRRVTGTAS